MKDTCAISNICAQSTRIRKSYSASLALLRRQCPIDIHGSQETEMGGLALVRFSMCKRVNQFAHFACLAKFAVFGQLASNRTLPKKDFNVSAILLDNATAVKVWQKAPTYVFTNSIVVERCSRRVVQMHKLAVIDPKLCNDRSRDYCRRHLVISKCILILTACNAAKRVPHLQDSTRSYPSDLFDGPLNPKTMLCIKDIPRARQQKSVPAIEPP
jgi:hypothetical protein